jgi:hypothetical protein
MPMAHTIDLDKLDELSVDDRLKLLEAVWLTLESDSQSAPSPNWHYA